MPRASRLAARPLLAVALAMVALCVPRAIEAQRGRRRAQTVRIAIGEVAASRGGPGAAAAFSQALEEALEAQPQVDLAPARRAQLVVRGSVVRWDRHAVHDGVEVRCEVSLIVADRGGSIRAMLRGRGGARGGGDPARLSTNALRAAVRGALRPLSTQGAVLASAGR